MSEIPVIPGYKIERELGRGGMATVYLAHEEKLEREVALKILEILSTQGRDLAERFIREAKTAAKLQHSNIVSIFDVGHADNLYYMAVEYLRGGTLREKLRSGPMVPAQALRIAAQMADALDYAHRQGFIHRDIKPDNIMFRNDGQAVLTDFGIARAIDSATKLTKTGMSVGTPHYMSPEQARGQAVDSRSDLYSLGIVLYEMLTGKVPFEGEDSVAVAIKHVQEPVPHLSGPLLRFQPLLNQLLAKDPKKRPQSGKELAELIKEVLNQNEPVLRPSVSRTSMPWGATPLDKRKPKTAPQSPVHIPLEKTVADKRQKTIWVLAGLLSVLVVVLLLTLKNRTEKAPEYSPINQSASSGSVDFQGKTNAVDSEYTRYFSKAKTAYEQKEYDLALWNLKSARDLKQTDESSLLEKLIKNELERSQHAAILAEQQRRAESEEQNRMLVDADKQNQEEVKKKQEAEAESVRLREEEQKREAEKKTNESTRYSMRLRSAEGVLTLAEVTTMLKRFHFFDKYVNPSDSGVDHKYEFKSINNDWVVADYATGLMWHQTGSDTGLSYFDAKKWVENLNRRSYAGHSNWRLPTLEEGASLLESRKTNGDLFIDRIFASKQKWIWTGDSSSSSESNKNKLLSIENPKSWVVNFYYGYVNENSNEDMFFVRPVCSLGNE